MIWGYPYFRKPPGNHRCSLILLPNPSIENVAEFSRRSSSPVEASTAASAPICWSKRSRSPENGRWASWSRSILQRLSPSVSPKREGLQRWMIRYSDALHEASVNITRLILCFFEWPWSIMVGWCYMERPIHIDGRLIADLYGIQSSSISSSVFVGCFSVQGPI